MYDALGRRTTLSDFWGVATTTYDALGRVTRESNRGLATQYEYDQNGNRTLMVDPSGGRFTTLSTRWTLRLGPAFSFEASAGVFGG